MKNFKQNLKKIVCGLLVVSSVLAMSGCNDDHNTMSNNVCNHNYYMSDYVEPGEMNGYKEMTCSNCGNVYQEVVLKSDKGNANAEEESATKKRSVKLFDLPAYSDKNVLSGSGVLSLVYKSEGVDNEGWVHEDFYYLACGPTEKWVRYDLDGKYSVLSGEIFRQDTTGDLSANSSAWLEFYDGDEFIGATPKVNDTNCSVSFEYDISGVEYLTVHLKATNHGTWIFADDVLLTK